MATALPYRADTPISHILKDGWARDFDINQTLRELEAMGFSLHVDVIQAFWHRLTLEFDATKLNQYPNT